MVRSVAKVLFAALTAASASDRCQALGSCEAIRQADHVLLQHRIDASEVKARAHAAVALDEPGEVPVNELTKKANADVEEVQVSPEELAKATEKDRDEAADGEADVSAEWRRVPPGWLDDRMGDRWHRPGGLKECQGNCHSNTDCADGLTCYRRQGTAVVPGCQGDGTFGWSYCHKMPPPPPSPKDLPPAPLGGANVRLAAFNVYYLNLATHEREDGIASALAAIQADIFVITEEWQEKMDILRMLRQKSGRNYEVCNQGMQEKTWDGDIMYDADVWKHLDDGVHDWGNERGLSWGHLEHIATGKRILVYGAHPLCCGNEEAHLRNAVDFVNELMQNHPEYPASPVVIMGDFNALEDWKSTHLYEDGRVNAYGRDWHLPITFRDTFRATHGPHENAITHNTHARLDYIFTERREPAVFEPLASYIWRGAPGGSDHYPIIADVLLRP